MNKMENEREDIKSGDNGTRGSEKITREKPDGGAAQSSEKAPGGRRKQKESAPIRIIDAEAVRRAQATLRRYKLGKANLERRIVENEKVVPRAPSRLHAGQTRQHKSEFRMAVQLYSKQTCLGYGHYPRAARTSA